MKRLIITSGLLLLFVLHAHAQTNLSIRVFFDDNYPYANESRMVWVEGKELKPYHLKLYRSISTEKKQEMMEMELAVLKDGKEAADKEIGYIGQRLYYAFLSFKPLAAGSNIKRYVFYRNASLKSKDKKDATLVYMEGTVSMEELKKMFK